MVNIFYGRAGCGKTYKLEKEADRLLGEGTRVFLIVPEQLSMSREYSFNQAGLKNIEVLSFTRLADTIFRTCGGTAKKLPDSAMSTCAVYLAIKRVSHKLTYYKSVAFNHGFVNKLLDAFAQFDTCCISQSSIESIPEDKMAPHVRLKYRDLFLIYNEYKQLWNGEYKAPGDNITQAAGKLELCDIFADAVFMFDGFYGFTKQQSLIIEQILLQASGCYFAFTTDLEDEIFSTVTKECESIMALCKKCDMKYALVDVGDMPYRLKSATQRYLEKYALSGGTDEAYINDGNLWVYTAGNINDELNFIACKIKNDVLSGKYRYRDIAVLCPDSDAVGFVATAAFSKHGVPLFADSKKSLLTKPICAMVLSALEIVIYGMTFETVFSFLKTGLAGVSFDEISILENYVRMWKIKGKSWLAPRFTQNPSGFQNFNEQDDSERLELINDIKTRALGGLLLFIQSIKSASDCRQMLIAVCGLFDSYNVSEKLLSRAMYFESTGNRHVGDEYRRIYEIFIKMLDSIDAVVGKTKLTASEFYDIVCVSAGALSVNSRPACADEVVFSSIGSARAENIKCVYLCRLNSKFIPATPSDKDLITDSDKRLFSKYGITTSMNFLQSAIRDKFDFYSAMTCASNELCLSCSLFEITGESILRSQYLDEIITVTNIKEKTSAVLPPDFYLVSLASASSLAATGISDSLTEAVCEIMGFTPKSEDENKRLSDEIVQGLYSKNLRLSFSGIEEYVGCPFKFFIHRGLRASKNEPVEMNPANIGTFIHFGLERLLSGEFELSNAGENDISEYVRKISDEYYDTVLADCKNTSKRFDWIFSRAKGALEGAAKNVVLELASSDFVPFDFEIDISKYIPQTQLCNGYNLTLTGSIDRVDMLEAHGARYAKIIDYKSGSQAFDLQKIYNGLSMQLPIYASAVKSKFEDVKIAAMYYLKVGVPDVKITDKAGVDDELYAQKTDEFYERDGIFCDDEQSLSRLGHSIKSLSQIKRGRLVGSDVINRLIDFSTSKIYEKSSEIVGGCVDVSPIDTSKVSACQYCDYRGICKIDKHPEKVRELDDAPKDFLGGEGE